MDKLTYLRQSQELNLPPRCPLVGYCERWALSIYFNTYYKQNKETFRNREAVFELLKNYNEVKSDFTDKKIQLHGESLYNQSGIKGTFSQNFCPEIALFDDEHRPFILPKEAIASYSWTDEDGLRFIEHKHFSECLEFLQTEYLKKALDKTPKNICLENNFTAIEDTAKQELIEFKNHIERQAWKDIFINNKPQENIARALLQAFLRSRSYREVLVRGGKTDILSFNKEGMLLYETKIWRGEQYHLQGLREIEEYIKGEGDDKELLSVFYVGFDPTKTYRSKSYLGTDYVTQLVGNFSINTITICLAPPQPSKIPTSISLEEL
ncbi:hypothetical protein [Pseudanabaena sp. ABRG5-3]|uniref:hypothetical protein n=1 Tax=Pseudanabaena sp. ABRG5-3 TaxID=685565 RepID=UPI000DC73ADF|nr:hypothetical protein [Pseudanabaena sp. ABRG5-3]BBC24942.1 HNH nuclease [Pseudanabaena sp. ABRG5-3]